MSHLKQPEFHTHENCVYFSRGFCTLNNVGANPNGATCPDFMPNNTHPRLHRYSYLPQCTFPPQTWYGYRARHSYGPISSIPTALRRGVVGLFYMSSGRRGGGIGSGRGGGKGRGRMGGFAAGPGGSCVCPRCGYTTSHVTGNPCFQQTCPKCGSRMTRGS